MQILVPIQAGGAIPVLHRTAACLLVMVLFLLVCAGGALAQEGNTGRLNTKDLDSVVIKGHRLPFVVRNDTLEFNTAAFKLLPNAVVRDLFKKLPGVLVGADGSITVNGKKVNKIQLDGRDFFGNNMEAALNNLTAEVIDKVQVVDGKSLSQQRSLAVQPLTGEIAINLTLKKDKKAGLIGNIAAGAGTRGRYAANGMVNNMGKTRIGLYGTAGNESMGAGGMRQMVMASGGMPSQGGLKDDQSVGFNVNTQYGKQLTLDVYYGFNRNSSDKQTLSNRLNVLQDSSFLYTSDRVERSLTSNHQLSLGIVYNPDSFTQWQFRPSVSLGRIRNTSLNKGLSSMTLSGWPINRLSANNDLNGTSYTINNQLSFNTTSHNRKLNLNVSWNMMRTYHEESLQNSSVNDLYRGQDLLQTDSIDQVGTQRKLDLTNNVIINLSAKIAPHFVAALDYSFDYNIGRLRKRTDNLNPASGKYNLIDSLLSNDNRSTELHQFPSFQLAYTTDRFNIALNTGLRFISQDNHLLWKDSVIRIRQQQFSPNVQLYYKINKYSQLNAGYQVSAQAPTAAQLSPVADNTDPLHILVGNPFLKASILHNVHLVISAYKPQQGMNMSLMTNGAVTQNQLINDVYYDSLGRQVSTYRNVNGTSRFSLNGNVGLNRHWGAWSFTTNLSLMAGGNREVSFVNQWRNQLTRSNWGSNAMLSVGYNNWFTMSVSGNWSDVKSRYSLGGMADGHITGMSGQGQLEVTAVKRTKFSVDVRHQYNSQLPNKADRQVTVCNGSVAYRFLSKEQLTLTAAVQDIFNRNRYISSVVMDTYRESVQTNGLRRYLLFTLAWNFNQLHGAGTSMQPAGSGMPVQL